MRRILVGILFSGLLAILLVPAGQAQTPPTQTTSFINVGQGDAALIQDGAGFDVLIDGGVLTEGPVVDQFLHDHGATDLDIMLASHADDDHIGGLITVLNDTTITIHQVLYNGYPGSSTTWDNFASAVAARGLTLTPLQFPSVQTWGGMTAYILNPAGGLTNLSSNNASVVVRVDYGSVRELFTGDIDGTIEATVVARQTPVAADILKVAHHGSAYSSSALFLSAVHPKAAVISVGPNSYGHPSADTISRLLAVGAAVYRTDQLGTITELSDSFTFSMSPAPGSGALFLPLVVNANGPPATPVPQPTQPGIVTTGNVIITTVFYDGILGTTEPDEYVEIKNQDSRAIQLQNWTLSDLQSHVFTFPAFVVNPGVVCRVYTNQVHPEWCGFSYGSGTAIWNNTGDTATLKDANGQMISQKSY